MPLCRSPIHTQSGQPRMLPVSAFRLRSNGKLYVYCRPCHSVLSTLGKPRWRAVAHTPYVVARCWEVYWQRQAVKARRRLLPPGMALCLREGVAYPREQFYTSETHISPWCMACTCIDALRENARRRGEQLTWEAAAARYQRSTQHYTKRRQKGAPAGTRWCVDCVAYFPLEGLKAWQQGLSRCPAHQLRYTREYLKRRRARLKEVAA